MGQRYKLHAPLQRIDTAAPLIYQGVASGADVEVLKPGCMIKSFGGVIAPSASGLVVCTHPGHIKNGDVLKYWDTSLDVLSPGTLSVTNDPAFSGGQWTFNVTNNDGVNSVGNAVGSRYVFAEGIAANRVVLYEDDSGTVTTSQPVTLSSNGMLEAWVDVANVDIHVSGGTPAVITTIYPDISTFGKSQIVSPQDFGAVMDGVVNDWHAVQAAFDYAKTFGGYVDLWDGIYAIDMASSGSQLTINSAGIKVIGRDKEGSVLKATSKGVQTHMLGISAANGTVLRDFQLDSTGLALDGVLLTATSRCKIENLHFGAGAFESGVKMVSSSDHNSVHGCYFDQMVEYAVELSGSNRNSITGGNQFVLSGINSVIADVNSDFNSVVGNPSRQASGNHWSDAGTGNDFGHNPESV